jgi:hypothetical protein
MKTPTHLIIITHTTRHLEPVLRAASLLTPQPTTLSVTCDVDKPEIKQLAQVCAERFGIEIYYTAREHHNLFRAAQVRNNGVRTLMSHGHSTGRLIFIDGDMILCRDAIQKHIDLGEQFDTIACERYILTEQQTPSISNTLVKENRFPEIDMAKEELQRILKVDKKRKQHQRLKRFGLTKPAKPKLISCHFSMPFEAFIKLNGFDECYQGYGCEDDDLGRRSHKLGLRYRTAASEIPAYHLFHPTQASQNWADNPGSKRFQSEPWDICCESGLLNPYPQNTPVIEVFKA